MKKSEEPSDRQKEGLESEEADSGSVDQARENVSEETREDCEGVMTEYYSRKLDEWYE